MAAEVPLAICASAEEDDDEGELEIATVVPIRLVDAGTPLVAATLLAVSCKALGVEGGCADAALLVVSLPSPVLK